MDERTRPLGGPDRPSRARTLGAGELVGGWRIVRALAIGGFGTVYEARHASTHQPVALKLLHAHLVASPEIVARFEREVQVIGRLRHPSVVELVGAGLSDDGRPFLCMELLDGEDLGALVSRTGPLSPESALAVLEPLCDALAFAHGLGVVHRDIKPSNVRVCRDGRIVLLDFGIAKLSDALAPDLTATNQSLGTPACMAPEQVNGGAIDERTDVYALGALLFHALTGRTPFEDASPTMSQYLHLHARRPRASVIAPGASRLDDAIVRAMAIEPAERFPDAPALLAAVRVAVRARTQIHPVAAVEASAILVTAEAVPGTDLDAALLDDLEGVLPAAERFLGAIGFQLAVDLGSSAIFVRPDGDARAAQDAALATWDALEQRPKRDRRVQLGICAHRGPATFAGGVIESPALLRLATWHIPDALAGVWVTDPSGARRVLP